MASRAALAKGQGQRLQRLVERYEKAPEHLDATPRPAPQATDDDLGAMRAQLEVALHALDEDVTGR